MLDWDLEAPGLETYFYQGTALAAARAHPGLIDMFATYKSAFPNFAARRAEAASPASPEYQAGREHASMLARKLLSEFGDVPKYLLDTEENVVPATFPELL